MERVLFICTGNSCRSPIAAGIFNRLAKQRKIRDIVAESAGVFAMEGLRASASAITVAHRHGINLTRHRTRPYTPEIGEQASLILTMTAEQWYCVTESTPREKTFLLTNFATVDNPGIDIVDPYGGSLETYEEVFAELEREILRAFDAIVEWVEAHPTG